VTCVSRKEVAEVLISLGAVLIPLKGKVPKLNGWQNLRQSHPEALDIDANCNIGVVLGDTSNGLVDVDVDCKGALEIADFFLPETGLVFGRISKPRSHRIYRCADPARTIQFKCQGDCIVELRGNGGQTMVPPSAHPSGENVEFSKFERPANVDWSELEACVIELAIATEIGRSYREGNRHKIA
jgi:hypothetical protein